MNGSQRRVAGSLQPVWRFPVVVVGAGMSAGGGGGVFRHTAVRLVLPRSLFAALQQQGNGFAELIDGLE